MAKFFKTVCILLLLVTAVNGWAQQTITLKHLWIKPQVEVRFGAYHLWFTIKDIEKAMRLLPPADKAQYGATAALDSNQRYTVELQPGRHLEYKYPLQNVMQNAVGAFLLLRGHAFIETGKHKKVHSVNVEIGPVVDMNGYSTVSVTVYDPHNNAMIFSGIMNSEMYYKDLGLD